MFDYLTFSHVDLRGCKVLVRVDINSPIDPKKTSILDSRRIQSIIPTLRYLSSSAVVIIAHQGRPLDSGFTTLELHAQEIQKYLFKPVQYIPDVLGPTALQSIQKLRPGKYILLENLRFLAEDNISGPPEILKETHLVRKLAPLFDYFVLDAFGVFHRSHSSNVGLASVLPTVVGKLAEKELSTLSHVLHSPHRPSVFLLGGSKIEDKILILSNILKNQRADKVLLGGILANVALSIEGYPIKQDLPEDTPKIRQELEEILDKYQDMIVLPIDLATSDFGERVEFTVDEIKSTKPVRALDIGKKTIQKYQEILGKAHTITANGPMGRYEEKPFELGTKSLLLSIAQNLGLTVIGGGHLASYAHQLGLENKIKHISTGGGATIRLLSGESLPIISVLQSSTKNYLDALPS
jgi:phosphoglycerate kinase